MVAIKESWLSVADYPPPVNQQIRLWVKLLNGQETEIHGVYTEQQQWDISFAWKINVLQVLFWQPLDLPYVPPNVVLQTEPTPTKLSFYPCLNRCDIYPTLNFYWDYTTKDREYAWINYGELLSKDRFTYTLTLEGLQKYMEPEHREAALWLWAMYQEQPIPAIVSEGWRLVYLSLHQWKKVILDTKEVLRFELSKQLYYWYCELTPILENKLDLETSIDLVIKARHIMLAFGEPELLTFYYRVSALVQDAYLQERWRWVSDHGSRWLRYRLRHGCPNADFDYVLERAAMEYPKFYLTRSLSVYRSPIPVPEPLIELAWDYIHYYNFMWYYGGNNNWILAKFNYLGQYILYRVYQYGVSYQNTAATRTKSSHSTNTAVLSATIPAG